MCAFSSVTYFSWYISTALKAAQKTFVLCLSVFHNQYFLICLSSWRNGEKEFTVGPRVAFTVSFEVCVWSKHYCMCCCIQRQQWAERLTVNRAFGGNLAEHRLHDVFDVLFDLVTAQTVWFSLQRKENRFVYSHILLVKFRVSQTVPEITYEHS